MGHRPKCSKFTKKAKEKQNDSVTCTPTIVANRTLIDLIIWIITIKTICRLFRKEKRRKNERITVVPRLSSSLRR